MHVLRQCRCAAMSTLALLVALCTPFSVAYGANSEQLKAELEDARAHLSVLYQEHDQMIADLNDTKEKLAKANGEMDELAEQLAKANAELDRAQNMLAHRVASDYKSGGVSFLGILLQSESFEELVSNLYYVGKLIEHDAEAIRAVKVARKELNKREAELLELQNRYTDLLKQQQQQLSELEKSKEEEQAYVESLSGEVQRVMEQELAEEQARRQKKKEARKKAEEEARKKAEEEARLKEEAKLEEARKKAEEEEAARAAEEEANKEKEQQDEKQEEPEPTPDDSQDQNDDATTDEQQDGNDEQGSTSEGTVPSSSSTDGDYAAWRASWINTNITADMSTMDKVNALYTMISSFPYDRTYKNFTAYNMYLNGCGTCASSSEMVLDFCADLGIQAEYRWASPGDPGYSSNPYMNHRNDYVWIDGVRYIVEANPGTYGSIRPRRG